MSAEPFFAVEVACVYQLKVGDLVVCDPVMGHERVTGITECSIPSPSVRGLAVLRLERRRFIDEHYDCEPVRFVARALDEPLPRLVPTAPDSGLAVQAATEKAAAASLHRHKRTKASKA